MPQVPLNHGLHAIVDRDDLPTVAVHTWHLTTGGQAATYVRSADGKRKKLHLARLILEAEPGQWVRFRNRNRLDCRRENLELTTCEAVGSTGWKYLKSKHSAHVGVTRVAARNRWIARVWADGRGVYLGAFPTEAEAAAAVSRVLARADAAGSGAPGNSGSRSPRA